MGREHSFPSEGRDFLTLEKGESSKTVTPALEKWPLSLFREALIAQPQENSSWKHRGAEAASKDPCVLQQELPAG